MTQLRDTTICASSNAKNPYCARVREVFSVEGSGSILVKKCSKQRCLGMAQQPDTRQIQSVIMNVYR